LVYYPYWYSFFYDQIGTPEIGGYEFVVSKDGEVFSSKDNQNINRMIPLPDTSTFFPIDEAELTSKTPVFSWDLIPYDEAVLYYRLEIVDLNERMVFASRREKSMTACTAPSGKLEPGKTYRWRIVVTDASRWVDIQNRANSAFFTFTMADTLTHSSTPTVDPYTWGAVTWTTEENGTDLLCALTILDLDGVSYDGSSHRVEVTFPDQETYQLSFDGRSGTTKGRYSLYRDLEGPPAELGKYKFKITDPDGNIGIHEDILEGLPLNVPAMESLTPSLKNPVQEQITTAFDNVLVDGSLFEDFNAYPSIDEIDYSKWEYVNCNNASIEGQKLKFTIDNVVGRGHCAIVLKDAVNIHSTQVDITVEGFSSDKSFGRIVWYSENNGVEDGVAAIAVKRDKVSYWVSKEFIKSDIFSWNYLAQGDLMDVNPGQTVTVSISWDGRSLTFDANGNTATYTYPDEMLPRPNFTSKGLQTRIELIVPDTTPTFTWDQVPGANRYALRFYSYDGNGMVNIWNHYIDNQTSFTVPPSIFSANSYYKFRLEAWDGHNSLDTDNVSKIPNNDSENFIFYTGEKEARTPYIEWRSTGVNTWNGGLYNPYLSFWVMVYDAQSVPNDIKYVKVTFPSGAEEMLYYFEGYRDNAATRGIYRSDSFLPIESGEYTFLVEDREGNRFSISEELNAEPIGYPDKASLRPLNKTIVNGTKVDFEWEPVDGAAFYRVQIFDADYNRLYDFTTTDTHFHLAAGYLKEKTLYRYTVETRREFFDENVDNGSTSPGSSSEMPVFLTSIVTGGTESPTLSLGDDGAHVLRSFKPGTTDSEYWFMMEVTVNDGDGVPENIASVTVTFPDGITEKILNYDERNSSTEGTYEWVEVLNDPADIPEGVYTFTVTDFDGKTTQVTDEFSKRLISIPANCTPAQDSVYYGSTVLIDWDTVPEAQRYQVKIYNGWDKLIHTSDYLTENSYSVPDEYIELGRTYSYMVLAYAEPVPAEDIDNYSTYALFPSERHHFTVVETVDTDGDGLVDELDAQPGDADADDDGLVDGNVGSEDLNVNGIVDPGETDPLNPDTDGDGIYDGTEKGLIQPETEDTNLSAGFFIPDADPTTVTDPTDADSDEDGILDGNEDKNGDGMIDFAAGETDPNNPDTDDDGIFDGTEIGLTEPQDPASTDLSQGNFIADADPLTTTNPADNDSDNDGVHDGVEDHNRNGRVDPVETDPLNILFYPAAFIHLKKGLNLVSIPTYVTELPNLNDWLLIMGNSSELEKFMAYNHSDGAFVLLIPGDTSNESFVLKGNEGLLVYAKISRSLGISAVTCSDLDLKAGVNLVGIACPPDQYSAYQLLGNLGFESVESIQRYSTETGAFESAGYSGAGETVGADFPIVSGEGYFIFMKQEVLSYKPEE